MEEIFPRYGCPLQIVSDNGTENVNKVMKECLAYLKIDHVLTSVYHSQSNAKVERLHRLLHDLLSKKVVDNQQTWDLYLNQALAAIRFNVSESSKFSPFYLLYNRDVVLPIDNILKPRRKYLGEEMHKIALQEQHKSFVAVRNNLKSAKKRQAKYADKGTKNVEFEIGDPVYYKNNQRKGKLDLKWKPYFRILERKGPVTYVIKNQLDGSTCTVHAEMLRLANVEDWQMSKDENSKRLRDAAYVIPPNASSDSDSDSEMSVPLAKLAKKYRRERDNSENESDIPKMELAKRLKCRDRVNSPLSNRDEGSDESMDCCDEKYSDFNRYSADTDINVSDNLYSRDTDISVSGGGYSVDTDVDDHMSVNKIKPVKKVRSAKRQVTSRKKTGVKQLLRLISDML